MVTDHSDAGYHGQVGIRKRRAEPRWDVVDQLLIVVFHESSSIREKVWRGCQPRSLSRDRKFGDRVLRGVDLGLLGPRTGLGEIEPEQFLKLLAVQLR